jgi:hypothetical protein
MWRASCGPLGIELGGEGLEALLLLEGIGGWPRRLLFEGAVHPFVPAVLLGMARLDALDGDAEAQPPDGELGQIEEPIGAGEGDAVVGADGGGETALGEEAFEGLDDRHLADGLVGIAEQQEARGVVGDGERIAPSALAELELALEVGAPQVVGLGAGGERRALGLAADAAHAADETVAIEHGVDGGGRWDPHIPARRRTSNSRILRAPQCGFSFLAVTIRLSIWPGSWLA